MRMLRTALLMVASVTRPCLRAAGKLVAEVGLDISMSTPALTARTAASAVVLREAVRGEALDGCPIADDHAVEVPLFAQDVVEQPSGCRWRVLR